MCCVTYLCQTHHDHDLLDEDIAHNILSGAYRLHDFAANAWLELVERFIHLSRQDTISHELIDALEMLRCERTQGEYTEGAEASTPSSLEPFKSVSPAVHNMLCKVAHFRRISLKGNFDKNEGKDNGVVKDRSPCLSFDLANLHRVLLDKPRSSDSIRQLCSYISAVQ